VSNVILVYKDRLKEYKSKQFPLSLQIKVQFVIDNPTQQKHKQNSTNLNKTKLV
jgi:ribosomal protein L11